MTFYKYTCIVPSDVWLVHYLFVVTNLSMLDCLWGPFCVGKGKNSTQCMYPYFPFFNMFAWHPSAAQNYRAFPPSVERSSHWKCQWLTKSRGHVTPLYKSIIKTVFLQHPANVLLLHILPNYNKYTRFNAFPI